MKYILLHGITGSVIDSEHPTQDAAEAKAIRLRKNHSIDIASVDNDGKRTSLSYVAEGEVFSLD